LNKEDIYLNHIGLLCSAGDNVESLKQNLQLKTDFMTWSDQFGGETLPMGLCTQSLPDITLTDVHWQSRNNQFALFAYEQIRADVNDAIEKFGADRVGVVIGTSTSGIDDAANAIQAHVNQQTLPHSYHYSIQEMGNTAAFIAEVAGVTGPCYGISTACTSGAKALISAKRLITSGLCDVVIAGGVDTLCNLTVQGFSALEAVSKSVCNPFSQNRDGINIGEAAALFVVSRKQEGVRLLGVGESSDAHHISAPEPTGQGAEKSMLLALKDASITAKDIDYINLHGTATPLNDQMESLAVERLFTESVPCSSTKPFTGHTLGAAGAIEAAISWLVLTDDVGFMPVHKWDGERDKLIPELNFVAEVRSEQKITHVLSNSFAFGGNNVSLVLERGE